MSTWLPRARALIRRRVVRYALTAVGLGIAGLIGWSVYTGRKADQLLQDARAALDSEDMPAAAAHLRGYVAVRGSDGEGRLLLARTLRRLGEYDEAEQHRAEAERRSADPEAARREGFLARLQRRGVRQRPTAELFELVGERRSPDRAVLEALYRGDLAAREWDRAGLWLHLWLEAYPDNWPPRLWQAELLEQFQKYDRARADYLAVLGRQPGQPRALLGVGLVALANRGDYAEAEAYLRQYLERDPGHADARLGLARCRYARGDLGGARVGVRAVLDDFPNHARAALLLGTLEAEAGHDAEAADWLGRAAAAGADAQEVQYQLSQVLRRLGRTVEAEAAGREFARRRRLRSELEAAARDAEDSPRDAARQYEAGRLSRETGDEDVAARWFLQALKADPDHRPSHAALADYYAQDSDTGAQERAEMHRRRAARAP